MAIQQQRLENNERLYNMAAAHIDAVVPFGPRTARFPPRAPMVTGNVMNHIHVSNSVVGSINTGSIGSINQTISTLRQEGSNEIADALQALTQAILQSEEITPDRKRDAVDALDVVGSQAAVSRDTRKSGVALKMLEHAHQLASAARNVSELFDRYGPVIASLFQ